MKKIFLLTGPHAKEDIVELQGKDYHHLARTLRLKVGNSIIIGDNTDTEFVGVINSIDKKRVRIKLNAFYVRQPFILPEIALFFSVLKGDKNEFLIQKCTEIGVKYFIPIFSENTIVKPDNIEKKIERWRRVSKEASGQSGRKNIPKIFNAILLEEIEKYVISNNKIFGAINGEHSLKNYVDRGKIESINILIGPEGDFTSSEMNELEKQGWTGVQLTDNILRSETAAIFISSAIVFYYGNLY